MKRPTKTTATELLDSIDLPHLREKGKWVQPAARDRAEFYIRKLQALGLPEGEIATLISDLYWDAFSEFNLRGRSAVNPKQPKKLTVPKEAPHRATTPKHSRTQSE